MLQAFQEPEIASPTAVQRWRPPLRAQEINLLSLVSHQSCIGAEKTVEDISRKFAQGTMGFMSVIDGERFLGVCSRRQIAELLGGRYGFSLWARKSISKHLLPCDTCAVVGTPIGEVLDRVFARPLENFYDDVSLVDKAGRFLGFITTETLFKIQNALLLTNLSDIEERDREIHLKNEQIEMDLRMAVELQQALMPTVYPFFPSAGDETVSALRFSHRYIATSLMGGDFFHIDRVNDSAAGILICDVMGHGVRAALVTAMLRAMFESLGNQAADPGAALTQLNREFTAIVRQTGTLVFATALYCVIEPEQREVRYARAGHPAPLRATRKQGTVASLGHAPGGPALGFIPTATFQTERTKLDSGAFLLLFTDGIIEAEAPGGAQFGIEGLLATVHRTLDEPGGQITDAVVRDARAFSGASSFEDDVCLVIAELY